MLQAYLEQFNYIGKRNPDPDIGQLVAVNKTKAKIAGCMLLQEHNGLPVTGDCHDEATVRLMHTPRCGLPDIETKSDLAELELGDFESLMRHVDSMLTRKKRRRKRRLIRKNKLRKRRYVLDRECHNLSLFLMR